MDINALGLGTVAAITALCYLVGLAIKSFSEFYCTSGKDYCKFIPVVCGVVGLVLGVVGMSIIPDFPATDYITAAAVGAVSGLAATGLHQAGKQLTRKDNAS